MYPYIGSTIMWVTMYHSIKSILNNKDERDLSNYHGIKKYNFLVVLYVYSIKRQATYNHLNTDTHHLVLNNVRYLRKGMENLKHNNDKSLFK